MRIYSVPSVQHLRKSGVRLWSTATYQEQSSTNAGRKNAYKLFAGIKLLLHRFQQNLGRSSRRNSVFLLAGDQQFGNLR